ncbi:MAG: bifunctional phosphoribosyl-AMP cyclohydrolase/phosphoribosyl-ATP diphosphatase HisIE [Chitinophagaceae bacterium]|nr:bifunctional phosphoribosyl-AMP cyclohydrolase/phosphoribosyl-ATP diphosphatase HisIE [Chitinophagaceae bacterium]
MSEVFFKDEQQLIPAIIQDFYTGKVLMLGYMNEEAYHKTKHEKKVTFYSRSRKRLWTKGETSGHFLSVIEMLSDCDQDTLLIKVKPEGPVCHTGSDTCFNEENPQFSLLKLEEVIGDRIKNPKSESYVSGLAAKGIKRVAQKTGEEAVELILESPYDNPDTFLNEAADLLFHFLILLKTKGYSIRDVEKVLAKRHR